MIAESKKTLDIMHNVKDAIHNNNYSKYSILLSLLLKDAKEYFDREKEHLSKVKHPRLEEHKIY